MRVPRAEPLPVRLREARPGDASALAALSRAALPDPWSPSDTAAELARSDACGLVAFAFETPGGVATSGGLLGYALARRVLDELHVMLVAVDPTRRRRGVGGALVDGLLGRAEREGLAVAHLEVREENAAARALYASRGFEPVGRRPRYYRNGDDAVLLTRRLGRAVRAAGASR